MNVFKFFQKPKLLNHFLGFDMDECVLTILRYKQIHNEEIIDTPTFFTSINVPIANAWITITNWRTILPTTHYDERIEIDYRVIEINNNPILFTLKMSTLELLNRIQIERF